MLHPLRVRRLIQTITRSPAHPDSWKRWEVTEAALELGRLGAKPAVPHLVAMLRDGDDDLFEAAAQALGMIGDPEAFGPLLSWATGLAPGRRGVVAVEALAGLGDLRAVEPLAMLLGGWRGAQDGRHAAAVRALGSLGGPRAVEALVQSLAKCGPEVRAAAAQALAALDHPQWAEWFRGDPADFARLGASGEPRAGWLLTRALTSHTETSRIPAADALGVLRWAGAVEALGEALSSGTVGEATAAARALGQIGGRRAVGALANGLTRLDERVRRAAAVALGEIGDHSAAGEVAGALTDDCADVRVAAARALAELGERECSEVVRGDSGDLARIAASGHPRAVELLAAVLSNGLRPGLWADVARLLGQLGGDRAVEALIAFLPRCHPPKAVAADALAQLADCRAVAPLIQALELPDWPANVECWTDGVRARIARALGQLGDARAVGPLIRALGLRGQADRGAAAEALAALGETAWRELVTGSSSDLRRLADCSDARAREALVVVLQLEPHVFSERSAAISALASAGDHRALEPALTWLRGRLQRENGRRGADYGTEVEQRAVVEALGRLGAVDSLSTIISPAACAELWRPAMEALVVVGGAAAINVLFAALAHPLADVRREAAVALAQLGHHRWASLVKGDPGDAPRLGAARDPDAAKVLVRMAQWSVEAAAELVEVGDGRAIAPLMANLVRKPSGHLYESGLIHRRGCAGLLARFFSLHGSRVPPSTWKEVLRVCAVPHEDEHQQSDVLGRTHRDTGLGFDFPPPPDGADF